MSHIVWKNVLRPPQNELPRCRTYEIYDDVYDGGLRVDHAVWIPLTEEEIVALPSPRSHRSLARAGVLLAAVAMESRGVLAPFLQTDPFCVGIYCAMEVGPNDYKSVKQMAHTNPEEFAATYRSLRSAKQYLRQLASVPASQLGIFLGIMGPQTVFTNSRWASLHALEQAECDLDTGTVKAALVCGAFSLEDPLVAMRVRRSCPGDQFVSEAGAALVLVSGGTYTDWPSVLESGDAPAYGIAHDLVVLAAEGDQETAPFLEMTHASQ